MRLITWIALAALGSLLGGCGGHPGTEQGAPPAEAPEPEPPPFESFLSNYFPGGAFEAGHLAVTCELARAGPRRADARVRLELIAQGTSADLEFEVKAHFSELESGDYRCDDTRSRVSREDVGPPCVAVADLCRGEPPSEVTLAGWRDRVEVAADPIRGFIALVDEICACPDRACVQDAMHRLQAFGERFADARGTSGQSQRLEEEAQRLMECVSRIQRSSRRHPGAPGGP